MKVLITGCNGLLGQNSILCAPAGVTMFGIDIHDTAFSALPFNYAQVNITDRAALTEYVLSCRPDAILHTAGYTHVDNAEIEKERCWRTNVDGTENLVYAAKKVEARLVYISTDYVFDGKNGPYDEEARPNPLGYYAKSKLAAENVVIASELNYAIVRIMVLYGTGAGLRDNFVTWLIKKLRSNQEVRIVDDQVGNTTLASELAVALWKVLKSQKTGIYNIAGDEILDRYAFALKVAEVFDLDKSLISPVKTEQLQQRAPRPLRSGLRIDKASDEFNITMSKTSDALRKFKRQFDG